jgi:hypothetical protein
MESQEVRLELERAKAMHAQLARYPQLLQENEALRRENQVSRGTNSGSTLARGEFRLENQASRGANSG